MTASELDAVFNYLPVDDRLATAGQSSESQLASIAGQVCAAVINLGLHNDPRYALANEGATVNSLQIPATTKTN
jgi:hypothetical protein